MPFLSTCLLAGYYVPVTVLVLRDPFLRSVVLWGARKSASVAVTTLGGAAEVAARKIFYFLVRTANRSVRRLHFRERPVRKEGGEWLLVG